MAARKPSRKAGSHPPRKRPPKIDEAPADSAAGKPPEEAQHIPTQPTCQPPPGIACPKCGGVALPSWSTRRRQRGLVRVRRCKQCNHKIRTCERIESNSA